MKEGKTRREKSFSISVTSEWTAAKEKIMLRLDFSEM